VASAETRRRRIPEGLRERISKMSNGQQDQLVGFITGLLLGAAIGASVAFLTAPQSGPRTRKRLGKTARELRRNTSDRWDDLAEDVKGRVDDALTGARKHLSNG